MFGHNERVGTAFFAQADAVDKLLVVSCFMTIQGEGPYRGKRCVFVRLAKCNLACSFCDTYFDSGTWVGYEELFQKIVDEIEATVPMDETMCLVERDGRMEAVLDCGLVITGGEPSLQNNLGPFLKTMVEKFKWVQIESNGIRLNDDLPDEVTLVVSPKCAEKHPGKPSSYLKPNHKVMQRANVLKFVMNDDQDSPYSGVPSWAHTWLMERQRDTQAEVFVSPMNIYNHKPVRTAEMSIEERSKVDEVVSFWTKGLLNMEANQKNHEYAARYAMRHGFTFQVQEHLYAGLA